MTDEDRNIMARLEYLVDADGEIYMDVAMDDYSIETIKQFAYLLASIQTASFEIQTIAIVQEAFSKDGKLEELKLLISELIRNQKIMVEQKDSDVDREDDPLIKPTDLM